MADKLVISISDFKGMLSRVEVIIVDKSSFIRASSSKMFSGLIDLVEETGAKIVTYNGLKEELEKYACVDDFEARVAANSAVVMFNILQDKGVLVCDGNDCETYEMELMSILMKLGSKNKLVITHDVDVLKKLNAMNKIGLDKFVPFTSCSIDSLGNLVVNIDNLAEFKSVVSTSNRSLADAEDEDESTDMEDDVQYDMEDSSYEDSDVQYSESDTDSGEDDFWETAIDEEDDTEEFDGDSIEAQTSAAEALFDDDSIDDEWEQ